MSLRDEIPGAVRRPGTTCRVATLIATAGKDSGEIAELVADPTISARALIRVLQRHGYDINDNSLTRHRRGDCVCGN